QHADQPTPPFNSPYQQHTVKGISLLESPYPSPVPQDTQPKFTEGLGLYDFHTSIPTGMPPSPQPSESWNRHISTGVSPMMTDAIADPWASGAFDHPVSHSPLPWASAQTSPRSSLSSYTREMSVYSHEGSEHAFPSVKVEYSGWAPEMRWGAADSSNMHALSSPRLQPLTVAPERLSADVFSYGNTYGSTPPVPKLESTSIYDYSDREYERAPSEESTGSLHSKPQSNYSSTSVPRERTRNRRHTDPANAAYRCHLCIDKGFARRYNYNQHMLTHDVSRRKDNICPYPQCGKEFVRKTDLARHDQSVHQKSKPFKCSRCPNAFSRKDTLRRHEEDGCQRRNQVPVTDPRMLPQL
ncbi:hypothetical protein GQ44DRAFT_575088, partial [Phaeosphaeriaceae sp. PMI808]